MGLSDLLPLVELGTSWGAEERHRAPEKPVPQHDCLGGVSSHLSVGYFLIISLLGFATNLRYSARTYKDRTSIPTILVGTITNTR